MQQPFPADLEAEIRDAYDKLAGGDDELSFAVRSSATAEDLPDASFAGQQETFLNVRGIDAILTAIREVFASLYNDRAIAYRVHHAFEHDAVALSAGVQRMVRSDIGASGVMFTMDTESGFTDAIFITSSYGLGEAVVQGAVNPDEFYVYKPALRAGRPAILKRGIGGKATKMIYTTDATVGKTTEFVDVAAGRPEPAEPDRRRGRRAGAACADHRGPLRPADGHRVGQGRPRRPALHPAGPAGDGEVPAVRRQRAALQAQRARAAADRGPRDRAEDRRRRGTGAVLDRGDARVRARGGAGRRHDRPGLGADHETRVSAIVTNRGGRTCHAAIIARELGIPAVVGTGSATRELADGRPVTVSCAEGDTGYVYDGVLDFDVIETQLDAMPEIDVKIMMNVGTPDQAFAFSRLPNAGVGLARLEFIINRQIGIHPKALLDLDQLDGPLKDEISAAIVAYDSPRDYFVKRVAEGVSTIAAAFAPHPVIVRMSDFKSNEYANLVGGELYEPHEENPMIGFRGAARYLSPEFADCFAMECEALRYVRDEMGLTNVKIMIPFVRTLTEAEGVINLLGEHGLKRGENDLQVIMMCELPSNAVIADQFLDHFDGFSIGSNDMTQLTLGLDRDSGAGRRRLRRARSGGQVHAQRRDPGLQGAGQVRGDLRSGTQRSRRPRRVAAGRGDRHHVAQPRHRGRHLGPAGQADRRRALIHRRPNGVAARIRLGSGAWMTSASPPNSYAKRGCWPSDMLSAGLKTEYKTSVSDVVSAADHAAEQLVTERLTEQSAGRRTGR